MFDSEQRKSHGYRANLHELADRERETALIGIRRREPRNAVRAVPQLNSIFVDQLRGAFLRHVHVCAISSMNWVALPDPSRV